ncbi:PARP10_14_15 [Mytilus edulis]|uniref:PARP10_14_15 n=1 Tax=Mytilus edulis TaxID=6550 RepID=A0A8S3PMV4_MYTED|nr:PARP10_14_15 [Mytilus edulis]
MQKTILKLEKELEAVRIGNDTDDFGIVTGMINPELQGQQIVLRQECKKAKVLPTNDTFDVKGTSDQILSLNRSLITRSKNKGDVFMEDSQGAVPKNGQPFPQHKQQADDDGFISYEDNILLKNNVKKESDKCIRLSLTKSLNELTALTNFEIQAPNDINIDSNKLQKVNIAVASVSEDIFWYFSYTNRTLSLKGNQYEMLQAAKHKCELILGIRQERRRGRGRRKIDTAPDYQSDNRAKSLSNDMNASLGRSTRVTSSSSNSTQDVVYKTPEGLVIRVYVGNILKLNVDCIVNAADETLSHGSLPYQCVIHAVGPKWYTYTDKRKCANDLEETVKNCFNEAEKKRMKSMAIPAISSGIFGVPREVCCRESRKAVQDFSRKNGTKSCLKEIHFVDKDAGMISMIQKEFSQIYNAIIST